MRMFVFINPIVLPTTAPATAPIIPKIFALSSAVKRICKEPLLFEGLSSPLAKPAIAPTAAPVAIAGFASGDDKPSNSSGSLQILFTAEDKAKIFGIMGAVAGAVVGSTIGLMKTNILINKNVNEFKIRKYYLEKRSITNELKQNM